MASSLLNEMIKKSRNESAEKIISVLNKNGDVLIFPEGTWNFTPNLPVQRLNWGIINIAGHADVDIVPVAVDLIDKAYCVIIGESFKLSHYANVYDAVIGLRDAMTALTWELMCMKPTTKRCDLHDTYWLEYIKTQYARIPNKDQFIEESYVYRPKGEISLGELLADMHGIKYKSMAVDYEQHRRIMRLCDDWNKPVRLR